MVQKKKLTPKQCVHKILNFDNFTFDGFKVVVSLNKNKLKTIIEKMALFLHFEIVFSDSKYIKKNIKKNRAVFGFEFTENNTLLVYDNKAKLLEQNKLARVLNWYCYASKTDIPKMRYYNDVMYIRILLSIYLQNKNIFKNN